MRFDCNLLMIGGSILIAFAGVDSFPLLPPSRSSSSQVGRRHRAVVELQVASNDEATAVPGPSTNTPPPVLNGKMVVPMRVVMPGLEGHQLAAVYAVLTSGYIRGKSGDGWGQTKFVGVTRDLHKALQTHMEDHGSDKVAHVRALSFSFPQEGAMQDVAAEWRKSAVDAGAKLADWITPELLQQRLLALSEADDDDDDDDDDDMVDSFDPSAGDDGSIVSPFEAGEETPSLEQSTTPEGVPLLAFTADMVDKVLEEVRPYLISDGGNVSVEKVEAESKKIWLKLEGACGSCASSTVTMSMGIERVLKENFGSVEVIQVEPELPEGPTSLTLQAIEVEVARIAPAISAMGGNVEIVNVDSEFGEVTIRFQGANKVQQGLEMALLDVQHCNSVKFIQ